MDAIETFEHNGYSVEIHYDDSGHYCNPRENECNLGLFLGLSHRNYDIGDERFDEDDYEEELEQLEAEFGLRQIVAELGDEDDAPKPPSRLALIMEAIKRKHGARLVLPVGMIEHSGVAYYVGSGAHWCDPGGWDSGICGFILDTPKSRKECGGDDDAYYTPELIEECLRGEIEEYSKWANGEVYGYVIKTIPDDEDDEGDEIDSCWGFIGMEWVTEAAKEAVPDKELEAVG